MAEVLPITRLVKIIDRKEFVKVVLDENIEAFVIYVTSFNLELMMIHLARKAQIALLTTEKVTISAKYLDYAIVFSKESAEEFLKYSNINKYTIDLELGKQLPYGLIYSLELVKLETFKTYIETNLTNNFIRLS